MFRGLGLGLEGVGFIEGVRVWVCIEGGRVWGVSSA